jgi:hypothetical protein
LEKLEKEMMDMPVKRVEIEKVKNGYIVQVFWDTGWDEIFVYSDLESVFKKLKDLFE